MTGAADWSGRVGEIWAEEWPRTERAFSGLAPVLERAILDMAPERGRFLDIGCGVGSTSLAVARNRPEAHITGVDLSADMIGIASQRGSDVINADFIATDALKLLSRSPQPNHSRLEPESRILRGLENDVARARAGGDEVEARGFDLFFSRHGVMFFPDPVAAFRALHKGATPAAALVFTCFAAAADNPWATLITEPPASSGGYGPGPFAFADPDFTRSILESAGWTASVERVDFAYRAGAGDDPVADAIAFLSRVGPAASAMRDAPTDAREALRARLAERLQRQRKGNFIDFPAAAWLWSARA